MGRFWKNEDLLTKAAITSDTNSFTGGVGLSTEEADKFLDYVIDESRLKNKVTIVRTNKKTKNIDQLTLDDEDVIVPGTAVTDPGETVGVGTSERQLSMKEGVVVVQIGDDALEDGIEGDAFADHVLKIVARAVANQLVKTLLLGKSATVKTKFMQSWNGWYYHAFHDGHVVDASSFSDRYIEKTKLGALLKAMPNKYLENNLNPALIVARHIGQDWRETFSDRETPQGDNAIVGGNTPGYGGIPMDIYNTVPTNQPVPDGVVATTLAGAEAAGQTVLSLTDATGLAIGSVIVIDYENGLEEVRTITNVATNDVTVAALTYSHESGATVKSCTADGTFALLAEYGNLLWGIQRDIRIETDRRPRLRATDWVISLKMDAQVTNPDALAVLKNLKVRPAA